MGPLSCLARRALPDAPTLLLLHGIQGTASSWHGICVLLPPAWRYILSDPRGCGASVAPEDPAAYDIEGFAADLAAVIAACAEPVVLVGWSMGVLVSLAYLRTYGSDRLNVLVLASGTACPESEAIWFMEQTL